MGWEEHTRKMKTFLLPKWNYIICFYLVILIIALLRSIGVPEGPWYSFFQQHSQTLLATFTCLMPTDFALLLQGIKAPVCFWVPSQNPPGERWVKRTACFHWKPWDQVERLDAHLAMRRWVLAVSSPRIKITFIHLFLLGWWSEEGLGVGQQPLPGTLQERYWCVL